MSGLLDMLLEKSFMHFTKLNRLVKIYTVQKTQPFFSELSKKVASTASISMAQHYITLTFKTSSIKGG